MKLLLGVLENYLITADQLDGKASNAGSVDQKSLRIGLPRFFENIIHESGRTAEFKVVGSIGNGNIAKVPWVGIFNRTVTVTAQVGYYIVLLFSEDMKSCFLSLNQGVTDLKNQYGPAIANSKIRAASKRALQFLEPDPRATLGPINLHATGTLGKGYEIGAIQSYRYDLFDLPTQDVVAQDFWRLLTHYDRLVLIAGPSLQILTPISEDEIHQVAFEKAMEVNLDDDEPNGPLPIPLKSAVSRSGYLRNIEFTMLAFKRAKFKCEIDSAHETFVSRSRNQRYVEAHHLVPMSKQASFKCSLDVPANIVALCATCHRLLHHGRIGEKRRHLFRLFAARQERLEKMEILLSGEELLSFYNKDLLED